MVSKDKKMNEISTTVEDFILTKFQALKEETLTKNFIIPLFKVLGYYDVDYHGGPYEEGKDIICWKDDDLDQPDLTVIQVKKFKPSASSSDSSAFSGLVNQLQQASEKEIPRIDGSKYYPSKIFFITPYQIDTRSLQSRFEAYASLKPRGIKIIDGPLLIQLLMKKLPHLLNELIGKEVKIKEVTISNLTNKELLNALKYNENIDISSFYSDLDFGIGRITTQFFFSLGFRPAKFSFACSLEDWNSIKEIALFIEKQFSVQFLVDQTIIQIEKKFNVEKNEYSIELDKIKNLSAEIDSHEKRLRSLIISFKQVITEIKNNYNLYLEKLSTKGVQKYSNFIKALAYLEFEDSDQKEHQIKLRKDEEYKKILKKYNMAVEFPELEIIGLPTHKKLLVQYQDATKMIQILSDKLSIQRKKLKEPQYTGYISGHDLSKKLQELQIWLQSETETINKSNNSTDEIRKFLTICKGIFDKTERILENSYVEKALGRTSKRKIRKVEEIPRLRIPIKHIFNTGLNIFVLGEAGAGKTTSLQMYAKYKSENSGIFDTCIFLPLGQMISAFDKKYSKNIKMAAQKKIILAFIQYFKTLDIELSEVELNHLFKTKNIVLLLDGLDEVIGKASWILKAINNLKESFPKTQLIVSSRMSGNYLDEIPFIGITLLPFTDEQREAFIKNWFQNKDKYKTGILIKHLKNNKPLSKIVRVPLLTTIFCVLSENNIPLPQTETRLFEERMRLLLGLYDIHKQAVRLKSDHRLLELVARKIAFYFHKRIIRDEEKLNIISIISNILGGKFPVEQLTIAVEELIDPCNILIPMSEDGTFGFGHLSFQEYLTATELCQNRGLKIGPYLKIPWWRKTLVYFSQITDDIQFILNKVVEECRVSEVYDTLAAMLEVRPANERHGLKAIIDKNYEQDGFDQYFDIYKNRIDDNFQNISGVDDDYSNIYEEF